MENNKEKTCTYVSTILLFGSLSAAGLLVFGLGILFFQAQTPDHLPDLIRPDFSDMLSRLLRGEPTGIINLGILVMMITPFLRVVMAAFSFFWERDLRYAAVALGVMVILLFTIVPSFV